MGMHVITWCDTPAAVERTFDRNSLREFDHRVLFQMSASDSSNLIDSPLANKLGVNRALAYSEEQGVVEKFRPYALPAPAWLDPFVPAACRLNPLAEQHSERWAWLPGSLQRFVRSRSWTVPSGGKNTSNPFLPDTSA